METLGKNNILPTGWIGVFTSIAFAYSCLCIYHGRTPLWPKSKLSTTAWGKVAPAFCFISYVFCWLIFPVVNVLRPSHIREGIDDWYATSIQLYPLGACLWGPMLWTGFLSYLVGVDGSPRSDRDGDEKSTASSSDTESDPKSTNMDTEAGKRAARDERRLERNRRKVMLCLWAFGMATHTIGLNFWIWVITKSHDGSFNWFHSSRFLLVLIAGFCLGGIRFGLEGRENTNCWDLLLRFLAFVTFNLLVISHIYTHILLAATSRTILGGIPVFDGLSKSSFEAWHYFSASFHVFLSLLPLSHF